MRFSYRFAILWVIGAEVCIDASNDESVEQRKKRNFYLEKNNDTLHEM